MKNFFVIVVLGVLYWRLQAQDSSFVLKDTFQKYRLTHLWEMGISANAYRGDLAENYELYSPALHLGVKFLRKLRWNAHFNIAIGTIRGQNYAYEFDENSQPNRFFRTNIATVQFDLQYNFVRKKYWIAYFSQGVGLMRFMPKNEYGERLQNVLTSRAPAETYANLAAIFPTSLGTIFLLKNGYGIGLQVAWLHPTTDYLDNISVWGKTQGNDRIFLAKIHLCIPTWKLRRFFAKGEFFKEIKST